MIIKKIDTLISFEDLFSKIKDQDYPFFLDSGKGYENKLGKFSFAGFAPIAIFKGKDNIVEIKEEGTWRELNESDLIGSFEKFQEKYMVSHESEFPFTGGLVGYFSYDLCHKIERIPRNAKDDKKISDIFFCVYDGVFVFDHESKEIYVIAHGIKKDANQILGELEEMILTEDEHYQLKTLDSLEKNKKVFSSNLEKEKYMNKVSTIKDYIKRGEVYQVNLTQRFETDFQGDSWELYKYLRKINPAPFGAYFDFKEITILSCSPERFLKREKYKINTRPIKGTISRGKTPEEDKANQEILLSSEKDKSELLMIVDLERNDLGKISKPGTVVVEEIFALEEYPTVFHLVSSISGELKESVKLGDILKATFPGGSITGTPKIRAMEIIDELEPTQRNIYTGSLGYIDYNGNFDLNIVIRTMVIKDGKAFFQAGGAIVWDSEEEGEYEESLLKARALKNALEVIDK